MSRIATTLGEELEGRLGDQASAQTARFGEVPNHWNGSPAATSAQQFFTDTTTRLTAGIDALRAVHTAATTAIAQIDAAVRNKADTSKNEFDATAAANKTPEQIDWIVDLAQGQGDTGQSV